MEKWKAIHEIAYNLQEVMLSAKKVKRDKEVSKKIWKCFKEIMKLYHYFGI